MFLPAHADAPPQDPAAAPVGEMRLVPVAGTVRQLPWHPGHAIAMVHSFQEDDLAGPAWECCPRSALARVLRQAQDQHGLTIKAGFESEFVLLHKKSQQAQQRPGSLPAPLDQSNYCQSSALDAAAEVLDALGEALHGLGIEVEQVHPESAPGQFEVAVRYRDAIQACDEALLTREAIVGVAASDGLLASFLPKLWPDAAGNGCHVHFSVWQGDSNLLAPAGRPAISSGQGRQQLLQLPPTGEAFLAGVLDHLPALLCLTTPSPNSYRWVGGQGTGVGQPVVSQWAVDGM
ncbi:hypothetical protein N2152v2_006671 [Parachlorella kessleri]